MVVGAQAAHEQALLAGGGFVLCFWRQLKILCEAVGMASSSSPSSLGLLWSVLRLRHDAGLCYLQVNAPTSL